MEENTDSENPTRKKKTKADKKSKEARSGVVKIKEIKRKGGVSNTEDIFSAFSTDIGSGSVSSW